MKNKRMVAAVLTAALCVSFMAGCGQSTKTEQSNASTESTASTASEQSKESATEDQSKTSEASGNDEQSTVPESGMHTLTIRDKDKNAEITATFYNNMTGSTEDVKMDKTGEADGYFTYTCSADTEKYNMVRLGYGDTVTKDIAFNVCVSGWIHDSGEFTPYAVGSDKEFELKYETKTLKDSGGVDYTFYVWTPDDYDASSAEKYSTIYMLDGQTVLTTALSGEMRSWNVAQHTAGMMDATENKAILVCIDAGAGRNDDYTPVLGENVTSHSSKEPRGDVFADFVCNILMPYIQENYNVYTDALHTSVAGSSMGGLESLYIGMEHPDKFGTAGVLSSSLWAYDEADWKTYFESKTYDENSAFLYFYAGSYGQDTGFCDEPMYNLLIESGYTKDKLVFSKNEKGEHEPEYWSNIYPEFLEAMFCRRVAGLEFSTPVKYEDRTPPENAEFITEQNDEIDEANDPRPDHIKNYVFFDNSELQWEQVYSYWWMTTEELPKNKATGEMPYGAEWPGIKMERIEGTDIYRVEAPTNVTSIIFSNGIPDSDVRNGVTAYQTDNLVYTSAACSGKVYKIDTSVAPKKGTGVEKTKFRYKAGTWTAYTE